jgi:hypothetical protein
MGKIKQRLPWWLEEATEECPACGGAYVYMTEYRCDACDGPVCFDCVKRTIAVEILCPGCHEAEASVR